MSEVAFSEFKERFTFCNICFEQCTMDVISFGCENSHTFCMQCVIHWVKFKPRAELFCPSCRCVDVSIMHCSALVNCIENRDVSGIDDIPDKIENVHYWKQIQAMGKSMRSIFPNYFPCDFIGSSMNLFQAILLFRNYDAIKKGETTFVDIDGAPWKKPDIKKITLKREFANDMIHAFSQILRGNDPYEVSMDVFAKGNKHRYT